MYIELHHFFTLFYWCYSSDWKMPSLPLCVHPIWSIFSVLNVSKNSNFLIPHPNPPPFNCLRNILMVPEWTFLKWESSWALPVKPRGQSWHWNNLDPKNQVINSNVRPRFFDQVGHQTINASIGNKYFFTK